MTDTGVQMKYSLIFIALLQIAACSSPVKNYSQSRSEALNITIADGITNGLDSQLHDVSRKAMDDSLKNVDGSSNVKTATGVYLSGAKYAGELVTTPGITDVLGGSIMLLNTLTTNNRVPALSYGHIIWMPTELVSGENEAKKYLNKLYYDASVLTLREMGFTVNTRTFTHVPTFGKTTIHKITYLKGNECDDGYLDKHVEGKYECRLFVSDYKPIIDDNTPTWLGNKPTYHWTNRNSGPYAFVSIWLANPDSLSTDGMYRSFPIDDFQTNLMKHLPSWIYAYLPPNKTRNYPLILNQDRVLYFIEPSI